MKYNRGTVKSFGLVAFALLLASGVALAGDDERIVRETKNIENQIKWVDDTRAQKKKEAGDYAKTKYEHFEKIFKEVDEKLVKLKEYYEKRLALLAEGKLEVSEELRQEEADTRDDFYRSDRKLAYVREAYWNRADNLPGHFKQYAETEETGQDIALKLEALKEAGKKVEDFYLGLSENGDDKDLAIVQEEADLRVAKDKAWHVVELAIEKENVERNYKSRKYTDDEMKMAKDEVIKALEKNYADRDKITELNWGLRVNDMERRDLWQRYEDAARKAQEDGAANEGNQ